MTSADRTADALLYGTTIVLPLAALAARRPPLGTTVKMALAWLGIFVVALVLVSQRHRVTELIAPLLDDQSVSGRSVRIGMASDGHFYAQASIDGVRRRMLVDSGATTTALSVATARAAGLDTEQSPFPEPISTANGQVVARTATVGTLRIGSITATDLGVVVSPAFGDVDVLGMNFLSQLSGWRAEGAVLILEPKQH